MNNFAFYPPSYNNYYHYYNTYQKKSFEPSISEKKQSIDTSSSKNIEEKQKKSSNFRSIGPLFFKNPFSSDLEEPILNILGLQLFLDDLIILGVLFFLYQEGVKDELLFIILILLLLT